MVGNGCVGAPIALDLARSGVGGLRLLDHDIVEPATVVRWPMGVAAAEKYKVVALVEFLAANYPYTTVSGDVIRVGAPRQEPDHGKSQLEALDEILKGIDLVVDATAESGVSDALASLAADRHLPFIAAWTTSGAWGGVIARVRPEVPGCWLCVRYAISDGSIIAPSADPDGDVQPQGCADPTLTGSSFDVATVSATATRLIAATLCPDYGPHPWDVGVLELRDPGGVTGPRLTDTWVQQTHPSCPICNP